MSEIKQNEFSSEPLAFLISVDDMEYSIIESLMHAYDIPSVKKHRGAGGYLSIFMGVSKSGVDVFVPEHLLEQAQELLKSDTQIENAIDEMQVDDEIEENNNEVYTTRKQVVSWILLIVFGLPVVILIISVIRGLSTLF